MVSHISLHRLGSPPSIYPILKIPTNFFHHRHCFGGTDIEPGVHSSLISVGITIILHDCTTSLCHLHCSSATTTMDFIQRSTMCYVCCQYYAGGWGRFATKCNHHIWDCTSRWYPSMVQKSGDHELMWRMSHFAYVCLRFNRTAGDHGIPEPETV